MLDPFMLMCALVPFLNANMTTTFSHKTSENASSSHKMLICLLVPFIHTKVTASSSYNTNLNVSSSQNDRDV